MIKMTKEETEALALAESDIDLSKAKIRRRSDLALLEAAARTRQDADLMVESAVADARRRGFTWMEIGSALGVTHQAARQRYKAAVEKELTHA